MDEITINFYWLIELFVPGLDKSLGWYVTSVTDPLTVASTQEVEKAARYAREEAEALAASLLNKQGVWVATEHGFLEVVA